jgi:hypothetical protein
MITHIMLEATILHISIQYRHSFKINSIHHACQQHVCLQKKQSSDDEHDDEAKDSSQTMTMTAKACLQSMSRCNNCHKEPSDKNSTNSSKSQTMGIGIAIPTNATTNNKIVFDANEKQEFHDDNHLDNPDNNANDLLTVMMTMMMSHAIEEVKSSMAHDKAVVQLAME